MRYQPGPMASTLFRRARGAAVVALMCLGPAGVALGQRAADPAKTATPGVGDRSVDLRPKFKAGDQHRFKVNFDAVSKQSLAEAGEPTQTNSQEIGLLLRVKSTDPETGSTLELVYESLKVKMTLPIGEVEFDSAKPKGDYADFFAPLVGLMLTLQTDKDGSITSVSSNDTLSGPAASIAGQLTGSDVVKNIFGPIVSIRKGTGRVNVGDTWVNEDLIQSPFGDVRVSTTNRLKSMRGTDAQVELKGTFSLAKKSAASTIDVKDSSLSGQAVWDTAEGMLRTLDLKQRVGIETRSEDTKAVSITSELTLKVTKLK